MRDVLAGAVSTANPGIEAVEFTELVLALTRGLEAALSEPDPSPTATPRSGAARRWPKPLADQHQEPS